MSVFVLWMGPRPSFWKWPDLGQDYKCIPSSAPRLCWSLTCPCPCLVPRLRSVKIEQGKVNDQANTLAELAKVSISRVGEGHGNGV